MKVSLDTNIWIFGLAEIDPYCERILLNLRRFDVLVPNQIRAELERNLSGFDMKSFYQILNGLEVEVDFAKIPSNYISMFEQKGLKKGDAQIGAFCEWRKINIIVSDNRDFLRGLSTDHYFAV